MSEKNIMIVDDDTDMLVLLELILKRGGFSVVKINNAFTALRELEASVPDLIVLDIMMPGISGVEMCKRIRSYSRLARVPIILLSARSDANTIKAGIRAGATDYITKTNLRSLIKTVNSLLTLHS